MFAFPQVCSPVCPHVASVSSIYFSIVIDDSFVLGETWYDVDAGSTSSFGFVRFSVTTMTVVSASSYLICPCCMSDRHCFASP